MEPRQLRYFEVTARREHLGRSATEIGISESTLSRSIARLELRYGPLFDRVGRGVRLNAAGRILLGRVERALAELENAEREIRELRTAGNPAIAFGFVPSLGANVVPDLVARFKRQYPRAQFRFVQDTRERIHDHLLRGDVDIALAPHRFGESTVDWEPLWEEELVAIVPPRHALSRRRRVAFLELAAEPILTYKPGHALRQAVEELAQQNGFVPNIVFEGDDVSTLLGLISAGLGVSLLPESVQPSRGTAVVLRLQASRLRTVGLSWLSGRYQTPLVSLFRKFVAAAKPRRRSVR